MNTLNIGTKASSDEELTAKQPSFSTQGRNRRNGKNKHRIAIAGLLAVLTVAGTVWRGAHAQPPIVSPMPLAYEFIPSPNFGERPANATINTIVLHATVEPTTEGTIGIFLNRARQVSAHFVVGRDGRVVQMVPLEKRAWHAGVSTWDGMKDINNVSVGIEMVNLNDGKDPYPDAQYQAVAGIIRFVRSRYTMPDNHIVSHAQIAIPQGRKSDPVGFNFDRIKVLARVSPALTGVFHPVAPASTDISAPVAPSLPPNPNASTSTTFPSK
jgi:N-acetylmuramoyl-L-alanine amidase